MYVYLKTRQDISIQRLGIHLVSFCKLPIAQDTGALPSYNKPGCLTCLFFNTYTGEHFSGEKNNTYLFIKYFQFGQRGIDLAIPGSAVQCLSITLCPSTKNDTVIGRSEENKVCTLVNLTLTQNSCGKYIHLQRASIDMQKSRSTRGLQFLILLYVI